MVLFLKHNLPTIDPGLCTGISEVLICGEGGVKGRALPLCAAVIQLPLLKKIIPTWATTYLPVVSVIFTDINDKITSMISDLILTGTTQGSNEECREVMSALYRCGATKTSEREVDNFEDIDNVLNESEDVPIPIPISSASLKSPAVCNIDPSVVCIYGHSLFICSVHITCYSIRLRCGWAILSLFGRTKVGGSI